MAKLKFDRSINLSIGEYNNTTVPLDEVWKVALFGKSSDSINVNDCNAPQTYSNTSTLPVVILGGVLKSLEKALLQGLPSRLLANIFAKEVSLA